MNSFIETLNQWGGNFLNFAWPMLWQSGLLIIVLFTFDFLLRRKIRASIRYALWLVVLLKLCLPPALALPTGLAWWLFPAKLAAKVPVIRQYVVTYDTPAPQTDVSTQITCVRVPAEPMRGAAWTLLASGAVSTGLLLWLAIRWWQVAQKVHRANVSEKFNGALADAQRLAGLRSGVRLKLVEGRMSPAVCGLFRPVILLPRTLAENLSAVQLRAVLLHELFHLRRKDVWVNCAQALLQVIYWWHPLLWLANARIRRLREEAVDDAVMLALRDEADGYAPTLLEVARLALTRPLLSLGLVGIMESRSALGQRIERLVNFRAPRKAGLTLFSLFGILAFAAVAVPMGQAPKSEEALPAASAAPAITNQTAGNAVTRTYFIKHPIATDNLKKLLLDAGVQTPPTGFFYKDNGILLVHGSMEQQALVYRVVLKLNGSSARQIEAAVKSFCSQTDTTSVANAADTNLVMRTFKVDPASVFFSLKQMGLNFDESSNSAARVSVATRTLLAKLGVNWDSPPGKSVYFNETRSLFFVRATQQDLNIVEQALAALNSTAPQIHIKARFLKVPKDRMAYVVRNCISTNMAGDKTVGVLTEPNTDIALRGVLEPSRGFEILAEPEVVTLSGRQARVEDNLTKQDVVYDVVVRKPLGTVAVLDTVATLLPDGYTIDLKATVTVTNLMGYSNSTNSSQHLVTDSAIEDINSPITLATVRTVQKSVHLRLWDDQSIMMRIGQAPLSPHPNGTQANPPSDEEDYETVVFITVTLVDPAGNRVHSDDEKPFAQTGVPPQAY